jgi:hypothetical protein
MNGKLSPELERLTGILTRLVPGFKYISIWVIFAMLMVIYPFIRGRLGLFIFTILFSLILISSILTTTSRRGARIFLLVVMVIAVGFRWAFFVVGGTALDALSYLFATVTLALVSIVLFRTLFKTKDVSTSTIWQAISVYMLLGVAWSCMFSFMEALTPGSFMDSLNPTTALSLPTLVYYSFVTLATLGYGDILPITQLARGLVVIEVLMGVLYMAILISRLVGTWQPGKDEKG